MSSFVENRNLGINFDRTVPNLNNRFFAKIIIDGNDGILIDISSGTVGGSIENNNYSINNSVYESTIELLCETLYLTRIKPESKLGPYKKIKGDDPLIKSNDTCSICLDKYREGLYKRTLVCNHSFHKKCVDKWFKKEQTCPICRKKCL
jgi:hypothetical protein